MAIRKVTRLPSLVGAKYMTQTMRVTTGDNKLHKRAAKRAGLTFSAWATHTLNEAAIAQLQPKPKETHATHAE
jgi:hypothetical protein